MDMGRRIPSRVKGGDPGIPLTIYAGVGFEVNVHDLYLTTEIFPEPRGIPPRQKR